MRRLCVAKCLRPKCVSMTDHARAPLTRLTGSPLAAPNIVLMTKSIWTRPGSEDRLEALWRSRTARPTGNAGLMRINRERHPRIPRQISGNSYSR